MQVYLNGQWLDGDSACVSVLDRGFLFGDGVYEVIPVYGGYAFRLQAHLNRLQRSLHETRIPEPHDREGWQAIIDGLIERFGADGDASVYLQVTRGVAQRDHAFPAEARPTVFGMINPLHPVDEAVLEQGVAAIVREDIRWHRCDIKSISLLGNVLLRQEAVEAGAAEAILIRDGLVTEGAASNVFVVKSGEIITPPTDECLLGGITRELVLELARFHGLAVREAPVRELFLRNADEIWLTSSTKEILPVTRLDGKPVGEGVPGPVWHTMRELYVRCKERLRRGDKICY